MPGTLFVVATPIGNLEDITARALRVLREVAVVAAEDTRRTGNLLRHFGIETRLASLHEHNEHERIDPLIARLQAGESVALVSDAGTPGVSDPGMRLVEAAVTAGLRVEPIPGPSAILTALVGSGLPWTSFEFLGFPPVKAKDRKRWFGRLASASDLVVFFEAPHRIRRTLEDVRTVLGNRPIVAARELTKMHEEFLRGSAVELLARLSDPRGEFTVVVAAPPVEQGTEKPPPSDEQIANKFGEMIENMSASRKDAIRMVAETTGLAANAVYEAVERHKKSVNRPKQ